ncbi:UNVERIFIED_CONTAM: hypothetical protein Slati_1255300 [Sesamum latifolium]|uniref:Uncharacterized protein n=1 Tax=Sesamum latifolium TaxID=2727402 RepID=A0AAW2XF02_9LAMI
MVEKSKIRKKGSIGEEDISGLLQRYSVKTVLTLLQEVAKVAGEKIDWGAVVKNTATEISSARECQMLWRHLAYGQTLIDQFDNAPDPMVNAFFLLLYVQAVCRMYLIHVSGELFALAVDKVWVACLGVIGMSLELLLALLFVIYVKAMFIAASLWNEFGETDDDSDLEYELEAFPAITRETSVEAAACVKVLIASDYPIDSHLPNNSTIEAPLTINVPRFKALTAASDGTLANAIQGTNISIPVSVQKQPLSSGSSGEKRPNNGTSGVSLPPRRKRRGWSTEDDVKLTAAVQKYGERNWADIARGDFENDRKASELSQILDVFCAIIRNALNNMVDRHKRWANLRKKQGNLNVVTGSQLSEAQLAAAHRAMSLALDMPMGDNLKAARQMNSVGTKSQPQSQKASASPPHQQLGMAGPSKSQVPNKRPSMNPTTGPDSMIKAAAVAAGARIATATDASSIIEAARSQNVVHIITGGSSVMKSSTTSTSNQLPSNVHFIRNGLTKSPISTYSATPSSRPAEAQQAQGLSIRPAEPAVQNNPVGSARVLNTSSTPTIGVTKTAEVAVVSTSSSEMKEIAQRDQRADLANVSDSVQADQKSENQSAPLGSQSKEKVDIHQTSTSGNVLRGNTEGNQPSTSSQNPISQTQDD